MNLRSKYGYFIITQTLNIALFVSGIELQTNGRTIRLLDAPGGPFRPGGIKTVSNSFFHSIFFLIVFVVWYMYLIRVIYAFW